MKKTNVVFKLITSLLAAVMMVSVLPACVISASANEFAPGDVDMNDSVDSCDALTIMRYSVGLAELSDEQLVIADVTSDGAVDSMDALTVLQSACGVCEIKPVERKSSVAKAVAFESYALQVTELCNEERAKVGLAPLELDETLCKAADTRASELDVRCDHIRADGTKWSTILKELDYHFLTAGENVAGGSKTPQEVVDEWMNSEGHRKNILSPEYTKIGVGYAFIVDSRYGYYWDQIFAGVAENVQNERDSKLALVGYINESRKENGLAPLTLDTTLDVIAEVRADDIAVCYDKEFRPDGSGWYTLIEQYDFDYESSCRQYLYKGQVDEKALYQYLLDIMQGENVPKFLDPACEKDYNKIGIGHAFVEDDTCGNYWTIFVAD